MYKRQVFHNHLYCVIHLGMSGTLHFIGLKKKTTNLSFYGSQSLPKKHNHIIFRFKNFKLIYNDPRRFGFFKILKNKKDYLKFFTRIGPEAISKDFNKKYLDKILTDLDINYKESYEKYLKKSLKYTSNNSQNIIKEIKNNFIIKEELTSKQTIKLSLIHI